MDEGRKIFPSQYPALIKARREIKQLEESLRRQSEEVSRLQREIERLREENEKLKEELRVLRQPPEWVKPSKTEEEEKRRKKKGPKFGHKANVRTRPDRVDRDVNIISKECPGCQGELPAPHKWHHHRQIDLPPPSQPIVTEYHIGWSWCKWCGKAVSSQERLSGSLYGPVLHAMVSYWHFGLGLTFGKISQLLEDLYHLEISRGQLAELVSRSASEFNGFYEDIRASLLDQSYLHADETGWRQDGDNWWLWSFSNREVSCFVIDESRGSQVVNDVLGKSYTGVLSSDFYNAYNKLDCAKQKCWAHLLRELSELKGKYSKDQELVRYSRRMHYFYDRGVALQGDYRIGKGVDKRLDRLRTDTLNFLFEGHRHPELRRLSKRLIRHRDELYTFIKTGVDPTNNYAEREIRPAVLMRKISYGNRSEQGAQNQAILMSTIRTAQKRGQNFVKLASDYLVKSRSPPPLPNPLPPRERGFFAHNLLEFR